MIMALYASPLPFPSLKHIEPGKRGSFRGRQGKFSAIAHIKINNSFDFLPP